MLRIRQISRQLTCTVRNFSSSTKGGGDDGKGQYEKDLNNPISRTFKVLGDDIKNVKNRIAGNLFQGKDAKARQDSDVFQTHCDVLVIGGGGIGSSVAYWLKKKARTGLNVVVVERDPKYEIASTVLSVGGLRQQFSLPENIEMSLFGADFLREAKEHLGDVEVNFCPYGYLMLATENGVETLKRNSNLQNQLGARNELLTPERLKTKFPWLNTEGVALGCHGLEKEGWFDPWALLMGFRNKAKELGAHYVHGEVINFEFRKQDDVFIHGDTEVNSGYNGVNEVNIRLPNGEIRSVKFSLCVVAAGASSGKVGSLLNMGTGPGLLRIPIPIEPRKRYVYVYNTQGIGAPGLATPLTVDPNGTYFRRDGLCGNYLCGRSPNSDAEPPIDNLDVDYNYFETDIWPTLAQLCKAFESIKVCSCWAGFYEYNTFDENGIIGPHPYYNNVYIAAGFSGHGIQKTPAVGRAISELIIDGQFRTIDLTRLGFDRIVVDRPMFEMNIV